MKIMMNRKSLLGYKALATLITLCVGTFSSAALALKRKPFIKMGTFYNSVNEDFDETLVGSFYVHPDKDPVGSTIWATKALPDTQGYLSLVASKKELAALGADQMIAHYQNLKGEDVKTSATFFGDLHFVQIFGQMNGNIWEPNLKTLGGKIEVVFLKGESPVATHTINLMQQSQSPLLFNLNQPNHIVAASRMDKNGSGTISKAEYEEAQLLISQNFGNATFGDGDFDGNGFVNLADRTFVVRVATLLGVK
jgi:hypothetical protein